MEKRSTPSLQITDRFGAQAAFASLRLPDGTEATVPAEHAAAIYVNEQPAFRVVCTPALLPQLALGRLLTEGWIASADEVEQIAVCAEGAKVQVYLRHPLPTRRAAAQEVASCCTDNIALGSPVELQPLRPVPGLALQPEWVQTLTAAMHAGLPLYRATRAVHSCFVLHKGEIVLRGAGGAAAGRMCAVHQRPGAAGYGAQGHPRGGAGAGKQKYAHRAIRRACGGIRPAAGVRTQNP